MVQNYIQSHISDGRYFSSEGTIYQSIMGWTDFCSLPHLVFSHRRTNYTCDNFYERLHSHDFYEIVFYVSGDVEYVNCDLVNTPYSENVIINKPGDVHTTRLLNECVYERYVLYFDKEFLYYIGGELPLLSHLDKISDFVFGFDSVSGENLRLHLKSAHEEFRMNTGISLAKAYSDLLSVFSVICESSKPSAEVRNIPESILRIKQYIDSNSASVTDVNSLANEFFYSREHLSRIFKRYFNIPVSDYIAICKVNASKPLLSEGMSVSRVSELCGFGTPTSFLRTFKKFAKVTPSEYIKIAKANGLYKQN